MNTEKLGVAILNRETGEIPVLSRSCNAERVLTMSLGNWEGKISDEAEPEELPDFVAKKVTARDGMVKIIIILTLLPCTKYEDKSVFL